MPTAVKVDEEAKSRLEELQAEIRLRTGRTVTQQALLTRLIDDAYESRDEGIDSFRESAVPLSEREKAAMREGRFGRRDRRGGHRRHPLRMTVLVDTGVPSFDDDFDGIAERTDPSTV